MDSQDIEVMSDPDTSSDIEIMGQGEPIQAEQQPDDPSFLGELATGVARGAAVQLPQMAGEAMQWLDPEGGSTVVEDAGKSLEEFGANNLERLPWLKEDASLQAKREADPYNLTAGASQAGEMLAPSIGPMAAGAALGTLLAPGIGTVAGGVIGMLSALPLYFGQEAKQSYDQVYSGLIKQGVAPETAHDEAWSAGVKNGSIEAGGELVAGLIPLKFLKLVPDGVKGQLLKQATKAIRSPKAMVNGMLQVLIGETGTEIAQAVGQEYVTKEALGQQMDYEQAKQVIVPTIIMSALTFGLAEAGGSMRRQQIKTALADPSVDRKTRIKAVQDVANEIKGQDPELANMWLKSSMPLLMQDKAIIVTDDKAYSIKAEAARRAAENPTQETPQEAPIQEATPVEDDSNIEIMDPDAGITDYGATDETTPVDMYLADQQAQRDFPEQQERVDPELLQLSQRHEQERTMEQDTRMEREIQAAESQDLRNKYKDQPRGTAMANAFEDAMNKPKKPQVVPPSIPASERPETPQQAHQREKAVDSTKDTLLQAVAKLGGYNRKDAEANGTDPAHFGHRGWRFHHTFTHKGETADGLAMALAEKGWTQFIDEDTGNADINKFLSAFDQALSGDPVYSPNRNADDAIAAQAQDLADQQAEKDAINDVDPGTGDLVNAEDITFDHITEQVINDHYGEDQNASAAYEPGWDAPTRTLSDIIDDANAIDENATESIVTKAKTDAQAIPGLLNIIKGAQNAEVNAGRRDGAEKEGQGDGVQASETAAAPKPEQTKTGGDIFGDDTSKAQALKDRRQLQEEKRNGTEDVSVAGHGDMFDPMVTQQMDLTDQKPNTPPPLKPNTVVADVKDMEGNSLGYETEVHDGTKEGIRKSAEKLRQRLSEEYGSTWSNSNTRTGATDKTGKAAWVISPNFQNINPVGSKEALYTLGHIDAADKPDIEALANESATSPTNDTPQPTDAQKKAGNYKLGHVSIHGLDISIENPVGSKREGTDSDGKAWSVTMKSPYGYFLNTVGKDKDHVDVFLGSEAAKDNPRVFVIDQVDPNTGRFDEHKIMFGFKTKSGASSAYRANYAKGWKGLGNITEMTLDEFKTWVFDKEATKKRAVKAKPSTAQPRPKTLRDSLTRKGTGAQGDLNYKILLNPAGTMYDVEVTVDGERNIIASFKNIERAIDHAVSDADHRAQPKPKTPAGKQPAGLPIGAKTYFKGDPVTITTDPYTLHGGLFQDAKTADGKTVTIKATEKQPGEKIKDFGEVLTGARKHYALEYSSTLDEAGGLDIATEPLSKSWPEPKYQELLDAGTDPWIVAFIHSARDEVPNKPKNRYKLARYVENVQSLRHFSSSLLSGNITKETVRTALGKSEYVRLGEHLMGRIDLYTAVGHEKSLKGLSIRSGMYSFRNGTKFDPPKTVWAVERKAKATAFSNFPAMIAEGDTRSEAIEAFKKAYAQLGPAEKQNVKFEIYSRRDNKGVVYIGKKIGRDYIDLKEFKSVKDAREYRLAHQQDLESALAKYKDIPSERKQDNDPRVGQDYRGGVDVTPEQFTETFGFRGVQFGNYVEGGRRQTDLNNAYDALMDMAGILGIPPKAISLNGELGLAFGARGRGGKHAASAHYEPGKVVINLTKRAGAGSLGHEWFHSVDNYFSRMRGGVGNKGEYLSENPRGNNVRTEMLAAFQYLRSTINSTALGERSRNLDKRRTKAYWSTGREMSARSFESYLIAKLQDQNASNDYLANIVNWESFGVENGYPYLTAAEIPTVRAAFDELFNTIKTKETDQGVAMFSRGTSKGMSVSTVEAAIAPGLKALNTDIPVHVVANASDPSVPKSVRDRMEAEGIEAEGVMVNGEVFMFANNISSPDRAQTVLFDHELRHSGLRRMFGRKMTTFLGQTFNGPEKAKIEKFAKERGISTKTRNGRYEAAEEYIVYLAESGQKSSVINDAIALIKRLLRSIGFNVKISDTDLKAIVARAGRKSTLGAVGGEPAFARTFHGTPHTLPGTDKNALGEFDLGKIGTGEGAQAYGHGIYLAENPGTAKTYVPMSAHRLYSNQPNEDIFINPDRTAKSLSEIRKALRKEFGDRQYRITKDGEWHYKEDDMWLFGGKIPKPGNLYTVDLPDSQIAKMLDWDAPLSEQAESVKKSLSQLISTINKTGEVNITKDMTGDVLYYQLTQWGTENRTQKESSNLLQKEGIPGIKYLDGGSRAAGSGTNNFVIFDPSILTVLERNGEPSVNEFNSAPLSKRGVKGDRLLDAKDLASDLIGKGGKIDSDGYAILYHRTTPEAAAEITRTGKMTSKGEDGLFFGTHPDGDTEGYGSAVVKVRIPLEKLQLNDVFSGQAHVTMKINPKVGASVEVMNDADQQGETSEARFSRVRATAEGTFGTERDDLSETQLNALNNKINPEAKKVSLLGRLAGMRENAGVRFRQGVADQYASIRDILDDEQSWKAARMANSSSGAAEAVFLHGPLSMGEDGGISVDDTKQGFTEILADLKGEHDYAMAWVAANRSKGIKERSIQNAAMAEQLTAQAKAATKGAAKLENRKTSDRAEKKEIRRLRKEAKKLKAMAKEYKEKAKVTERLFTDEQITELSALNRGTMADGRDRGEVYQQFLGKFNALQNSVLDIAEKSGLIDPTERATWDSEFYVPFFRVMEGNSQGPMNISGITGQTAFHKLHGSERPLNDLLTNTVMNWSHLLSASLKNKAAVGAMKSAVELGIAKDVTAKAKQQMAISGKPLPDAVFIRVNGEVKWYQINDPLVMQSLESMHYSPLNQPGMKEIMDVLSWFKRVFTFGVTQNPSFWIANLMRDTLHSLAVSDISAKSAGVGNVMQGIKGVTDKALRHQLLASGGEMHFGHLYSADPDAARNALMSKIEGTDIINSGSARKSLWNIVKKAGYAWAEVGSAAENINRSALYQQLREQGASHFEASFQARDLLDFSQQGTWTAVRFLTRVVPFLGARIQGLERGQRGATHNPAKFAAVTGMIAMASIALYLAYKDDDDFKAREQWDRDTYWWFKSGGKEFRIPKPFEVGVIGTVAERMIEQFVDREAPGKLFVERMKQAVFQTFAMNPSPLSWQVVKPIAEVWGNVNTFTKRPIESMGMEGRSKPERRRSYTSETATALSRGMYEVAKVAEDIGLTPRANDATLSPVQIEHLIRGYFGWIGGIALGIADKPLRLGLPLRPDLRIEDMPVVGRFVRNTSDVRRYTRYSEEFYQYLTEARELHRDLNYLKQIGARDRAQELRSDNRLKIARRQRLNKVAKSVSKYNRMIGKIRWDKNYSGAEKAQRIDRLISKKNHLLKSTVEYSRSAFQ